MMTHLWNVFLLYLTASVDMCSANIGPDQPSVLHGGVAVNSNVAITTRKDTSRTTDMTPVQEAQYTLNITNKGIAALDSTIKFDAKLVPTLANFRARSNRFIYHWMNTATKRLTQTVDGLSSSSFVTFDSKSVTVGDYLMTVAVYLKDDPTTIVAFETRKFTLTQQLNGLLSLTQELDYQRHASTFSTSIPVTLTAVVVDQFLQSDLGYEYFWFEDSHQLGSTKQDSYTTIFSRPFNCSLASFIVVYTKSYFDPAQYKNSGSLLTVTDAPSDKSSTESLNDTFRTRALGQEYRGKEPSFMVHGMFQEPVTFKDPISKCIVVRVDEDEKERAINVKKTVSFNITCAGSTPSSVCVNITEVNSSLPVMQACKPELFIYKLHHIVTIQMASTGWKDIHFFVYNDISRYQLVETFYGYDPDSINVPALTLPIVFGVVGIIIIIIGGVYYVRLRKKPLVEVADFDFHPSLTQRQTQERLPLLRVVNTIRSVFPQGPSRSDNSRPQGHNNQFKKNGSYVGFYESL